MRLFPFDFLPTRHEQLSTWPQNTLSPDPGIGSVVGPQGRMTSHQISHRLSLLVLFLLLIKARLSGINQLLCWAPSFCLLPFSLRFSEAAPELRNLFHWSIDYHFTAVLKKHLSHFLKYSNIYWTWKHTRHWVLDNMNHVLETPFLHRL